MAARPFVCIVLSLLPLVGAAEGAVRVFECTVVRACGADGTCSPATGAVAFRMEPLALAADGSGRYSLRYDDIAVEMQALSYAGPFYWLRGAERNTLLASSAANFLWHSLAPAAAPAATVRFLECRIRQ